MSKDNWIGVFFTPADGITPFLNIDFKVDLILKELLSWLKYGCFLLLTFREVCVGGSFCLCLKQQPLYVWNSGNCSTAVLLCGYWKNALCRDVHSLYTGNEFLWGKIIAGEKSHNTHSGVPSHSPHPAVISEMLI